MTEESAHRAAELAELTAEIVSAYVSNNPLPVSGLPDVIASIHASLSGLGTPIAPVVEPQTPAVNPKKSVFPDYIICIEDGKKFKSLKRHLATHFDLTPDAYREKWGLPRDYPMVAPNYAAARSQLAKASGLGRKSAPVEMAPVKKTPAKRMAKV
ncbi:MucR family transcriptional regulator [Mesorhizobium carmichaelinearum]|uniref:MucR family transcriptional regulator n=1 Tax=Mesorhizobium carmichaelinearum TaxID=1208188 RepID=UPI000BA47996|nr:MucR family transcriptional regulator [Mesorhizobium carmichaelinearum]